MKTLWSTIAFLIIATTNVWSNTFTVTNNGNSGAGSLAQAITDANNHVGLDTIAFNIPGAGLHTIIPTSDLPAITDPVVIDGYTQPGTSTNTLASADNAVLLIEIDGGNADIVAGPTISAGGAGSTIRGLVINRVGRGNGINLQSSNCVIEGCFIGTNSTGLAVVGNNGGAGIRADTGPGNRIGGLLLAQRNIISGNVNGIQASESDEVIEGNFIGVDATGTKALPNTSNGVRIESSGSGNLIGGTSGGARNIISGNGNAGVEITFGPFGNTVQGNFIGVDASGTKALGNANTGVNIAGIGNAGSIGNNVIGGTTAAARNIISANGQHGVAVAGQFEANDLVQGNFIGTDVTGTAALGNVFSGVVIVDATNTTVGGKAAGAGNLIAHNGQIGVDVFGPTINNAIFGNSIFDNGKLGIDLNFRDGVTLNDPGDIDDGVNHLQNFPVLESVVNSGGMTTITGRLNSAASTMYRIEFFANDLIDGSGYGEGQIFLGFKNVTTNASGNASFSMSFPQIVAGQRVSSTATDPNNNTSEFSGAIGQLLNISTRMEVLTDNSVLIGGFIIGGSGNKEVLLRALGPTLTQFGVTGVLADPTLELHDGAGALITSNDNWKDTQQTEIQATGLAPPNNLESAILRTFSPGNYTAIVRGKNNTTGIGLVEAYDIDQAIGITLTNISTRGFVDTNQNVMIGGFISGNGIVRVIIRALGPTLSQFGVTNVLADPMLELHDGDGALLASNDNWADTQQAEIQASGFAPPNAGESAIIAVRPAANSTAIVRGKNGTTGNALVEVYILPP